MRLATTFTALVATTLVSAAAYAQTAGTPTSYPQPLQAAPFGGYRHASTIAEGALRGQADLVRSMGEYNYNTAASWLVGEHAYSVHLDNQVQYTQSYYEKIRIHDHYVAETRHQRPSPEQAHRLSQMGVPNRPSPAQVDRKLGAIYWPAVLEQEDFTPFRVQLESLVEARAPGNSGVGSVNYRQIKVVTEQMTHLLQERLPSMDSSEYLLAKKFIASLAFEARFPLEPGEEVAAN